MLYYTDASVITSLTLSTRLSTLSTGDSLILVCEPDSPMPHSIDYHVVWRHNRKRVPFGHHLSDRHPAVFTATYIGHKHFLIAIAPTSNHSGNYSCTLQTNQNVSSHLSISVQPGNSESLLIDTQKCIL